LVECLHVDARRLVGDIAERPRCWEVVTLAIRIDRPSCRRTGKPTRFAATA
jgi:hypothetical protein